MSRQLPLLTERILEWWVGQEELLQNDAKPHLQPLRLASPKAEKVANSLLASLVKQKLRRLLERVKERPCEAETSAATGEGEGTSVVQQSVANAAHSLTGLVDWN